MANYTNAAWADEAQTTISVTIDGWPSMVPAGHRAHRQMQAAGVPIAAWQGAPLAEVIVEVQAGIDADAEEARQRYLTPGAGQMAEYRETEAEADRAVAEAAADFTGYPWLKAERDAQVAAGGADKTVQEIAAEVQAQRDAWISVGVDIKRLRRQGKLDAEAAGSAAEARAVRTAIVWPSPA